MPSDLDKVRAIAGENTLDLVLVISGFHYVNRIADLLDVTHEALPASLRKFEPVRRFTVRLSSFLMSRMDTQNRIYNISYEEAVNNLSPPFEQHMQRQAGDDFVPLKTRPKLIEAIQLMLEERDSPCSLDHKTLAHIHRLVEKSLPSCSEELDGPDSIPQDPLEAFVYVGTRYASRTSVDMVNSLREKGYDDFGILDLAIAIAHANLWARLYRLTGLGPNLFYITI